MNIAEKIKMVFEGATCLSLLYGNNNEINRAIGYGQLPCGIMRLIDTTTIVQDNGTIVERASVFVGVINMTSEETPSYATERVISSCRDELYKFIKATYNNDLVRFGSLTDATRLYEQYDDIVCGYGAQITIEEYPSSCIEPSSPYQAKDVEPSIDDVLVLPDGGYVALSQVLVKAVTADIDANIVADNIKKDVTILGVTGTLASKPEQSKTVAPQTSELTVLPDEGYALSDVKVEAVTSEIDANIVAGNIKKDVTILGVEGSYEGETTLVTSYMFTWYYYVEDSLVDPHVERTRCLLRTSTISFAGIFQSSAIYNMDLSHWEFQPANVSNMFNACWANKKPSKPIYIDVSKLTISPGQTNITGMMGSMFLGINTSLINPQTDILFKFFNVDWTYWQDNYGNKTTMWSLGQFALNCKVYRLIFNNNMDNSFAIPSSNQATTRAQYREMFESLPNVTDGQVFSIGSAGIAKLNQEDITYITSKGWTLA